MRSSRMVATGDGVTLAVHDLGGDAGAPLLVLAHATGFHAHVWQPVADLLAGDFRCVAFDERGHGDSTSPADGNFDWHRFADDALDVVDALDPRGPVFAAGHSCGGALLLIAEQARPGTFSGMYCYEPVIFARPAFRLPEGVDHPLATGARKRRSTFPSKQAAYDNYAAKRPFSALHPDALWAYVEHGFAADGAGGVRLKCAPEDEARTYEQGLSHRAWDGLEGVRCAVTVACGETTDAFPPQLLAPIVERLPNARPLDVLAGAGHFGPLERPAAVADGIRRALLPLLD